MKKCKIIALIILCVMLFQSEVFAHGGISGAVQFLYFFVLAIAALCCFVLAIVMLLIGMFRSRKHKNYIESLMYGEPKVTNKRYESNYKVSFISFVSALVFCALAIWLANM